MKAKRFKSRDSLPLVCVDFSDVARSVYFSELTLPQRWAFGRKCDMYGHEYEGMAGREWLHFVGDSGHWLIDLKVKTLTVEWTFQGIDAASVKPKFRIERISVNQSASSIFKIAAIAQDTKKSRWASLASHERKWLRFAKRLRVWLVVIGGLLAAAAILVSQGQLFGLEIQSILGMVSAFTGTLAGLIGGGGEAPSDGSG